MTRTEYEEHQEKLKGYQKKWDDEEALAKRKGRAPDRRARLWLDKQPLVEKKRTLQCTHQKKLMVLTIKRKGCILKVYFHK